MSDEAHEHEEAGSSNVAHVHSTNGQSTMDVENEMNKLEVENTDEKSAQLKKNVKPIIKKKKKKLPNLRIFYGTFVHSTKEQPLVIMKKWLVGVENGKIIFSESSDRFKDLIEKYKLEDVKKEVTLSLAEGTFMIPGFVDAHADITSFVSAGIQDPARRREKQQLIHEDRLVNNLFDRAMTRSLTCGTTTVAYNGTHTESVVRLLANKCVKHSQHGFVGFDVAMPEHQEDLLMFQITKCVDVIKHIQRKGQVEPQLILSSPLPAWLGQRVSSIQQDTGVRLKVSLYNGDTDSLPVLQGKTQLEHHEESGLINDKTILLHSPVSELTELELIKSVDAAIVFCPASDIGCGVFTDLGALIGCGVKLALGTADSSSLSMLDAIRQCALVTKNHRSVEISDTSSSIDTKIRVTPTYHDYFRLSTLGGAEVLNLEDRIGSFEVGKDFDAALVDPHVSGSPFFLVPNKDSAEDILEKFIFCGDDRNITAVYIAGQRVK